MTPEQIADLVEKYTKENKVGRREAIRVIRKKIPTNSQKMSTRIGKVWEELWKRDNIDGAREAVKPLRLTAPRQAKQKKVRHFFSRQSKSPKTNQLNLFTQPTP